MFQNLQGIYGRFIFITRKCPFVCKQNKNIALINCFESFSYIVGFYAKELHCYRICYLPLLLCKDKILPNKQHVLVIFLNTNAYHIHQKNTSFTFHCFQQSRLLAKVMTQKFFVVSLLTAVVFTGCCTHLDVTLPLRVMSL